MLDCGGGGEAASYNNDGRGYGSLLASDSTRCKQVLEVLIGDVRYLVGTLPPSLYGNFI